MVSRVGPRFSLFQLPQRNTFGLLLGRRAAFGFCGALLALGGCQYVSGAADLKVEQGSPSGVTGAGTSGQGGGGGAAAGGASAGTGGGGAAGSAGAPENVTGGDSGNAGPWDCVGEPLRDPGSSDYQTSGTVSELNTQTAISGATVSACLSSDADCKKPLASVEAPEGMFSMIVPRAFQGYFRVQAPEPFVSAIVQMTMPISLMSGRPDIVLFQKSTLDSLAKILTTTIDSNAGHAFFSVADCNGEPARNIAVTVSSADAGSYSSYYLADNSIPTKDRTYTGQQGGGGFVNLAPGLATFQVIKVDTDVRLATVVAPIKAGVTTFFQVQPH